LNSWRKSRDESAAIAWLNPDVVKRSCIVCLAIPGRIVEFDSQNPQLALVDVVGVRRKVDLGLLQDEPPVLGDWVLIHVGFAMSKISEADAVDQMRTLTMLGETDAAMQEVRGYGLENDGPNLSAQERKT
jgi:hydrogenase expression/formation protein HypC